jgi:hypothetical protein
MIVDEKAARWSPMPNPKIDGYPEGERGLNNNFNPIQKIYEERQRKCYFLG